MLPTHSDTENRHRMNLPSFRGHRLFCPRYNLRPPGSGSARAAIPKPNEVAKILVLGKEAGTSEENTPAEDKLLENAAASQPTGDSIRELIENERTGTVSKSPDLTETLTKDQK